MILINSFPIFPNSLIDYLHQRFTFFSRDTYDESHSIIRLITSFSTTRQDIYEFLSSIIQFQEKDAFNDEEHPFNHVQGNLSDIKTKRQIK